MRKWFHNFFAVENEVNENTVMGTLFAVVLIVSVFMNVDKEIVWTLAGIVLSFFGLGALKK